MINKFNFSYSTYDVFKKSPLWFYFLKISNESESDEGIQVYGNAGNAVHKAMENFINKDINTFNEQWKDYDIDNMTGFHNQKLSKEKFELMYYQGKYYYCNEILNTLTTYKTELRIEKEFFGMNFKGFIDLYTVNKGDIIIYDWKTNSSHDRETHRLQRLLYSWLIWKIKGIIPTCKWIYLKDMDVVKDKFTEEELNKFTAEILDFMQTIQKWGMDISKYEGGDWKNPFNKYYTLCRHEMERRQESGYIEIHMSIKGHYVFFEGDVPAKLQEGIDFKTRFDLKDKYFMQQQVKKKARGMINLEDIGTVHLYNRKFKCFPIGLLDPVTDVCKEYASYYNKEVKIFLYDKRDKSVLNYKTEWMPKHLITDKILRDYQVQAITSFLRKESGIINIPTGGGKTLVASEIIREVKGKTLWIIDRKELLYQTKEELEKLLGIPIGVIGDGKFTTNVVTIATVQSLNSKLKELQDYLYKVNFVVVDEFHKSAAETYQKVFAKIPNAKYRLGLTATVARDDGKVPILYSILGEVIYKITSDELIAMGYLVQPTIQFHKLDSIDIFTKIYSEDYRLNISEHQERNETITDLTIDCKNSGKKILILTKLVNHGKILQKYIPGSQHIHGRAKDRKQIMQDFRDNKFNILIMTLSIGAEGLDIPDLDVIINAAANKGDVKSIQILGRVLRIFKNKKSALYIDFIDGGKYTRRHSEARMKIFQSQGYKVNVI